MSDMIEIDGYQIRTDCKYLETHEWIRVEGDHAYIGISDYAQKLLKEIAYVELPEVGATISAGDTFVYLESLKATGDVYAPVDLEVVEINEELDDKPELLNEDPYGAGFLVKVKISDASQLDKLLDAEAYKAHLEKEIAAGH